MRCNFVRFFWDGVVDVDAFDTLDGFLERKVTYLGR